jgi:hypothetical protein
MIKSKIQLILSLAILSMLLNSCSVIGGIFKAGMGFGIFIVITIIVVIVALIMRSGKNK